MFSRSPFQSLSRFLRRRRTRHAKNSLEPNTISINAISSESDLEAENGQTPIIHGYFISTIEPEDTATLSSGVDPDSERYDSPTVQGHSGSIERDTATISSQTDLEDESGRSTAYYDDPSPFLEYDTASILRGLDFDLEYCDPPTQVRPPSVSPIERIPPELLGELFLRCCSTGDVRPNATDAPLILGQICKRWREVALSTPRLWSSLTAVAGDGYSLPHLPLIRTWINRSSSCPLTLSFVYDRSYIGRTKSPGAVESILDIFFSHRSRWKNISFNFNHIYPQLNIPSGIPIGGIPFLEHIEIYTTQRASTLLPKTQWLSSIFIASPLLHRVTCRGATSLASLKIPWAQLTHIDLEIALSVKDCLEILRLGPKLLDCRFHMESAPEGSLSKFPVLAHQLTSLYISSQENLAAFFDHLVLPNLHSIGVSARWTPAKVLPPWPQAQFISFLSRSSCSISTFTVRCLAMSDEEFLECLLYLTDTLIQLEVFVLPGQGALTVTDSILKFLTHHEDSCLCPKLESITLCCCIAATDGVLSEMVESRWHGYPPMEGDPLNHPRIARLKHIEVAFSNPNHFRDSARLKEMLGEGLDITM